MSTRKKTTPQPQRPAVAMAEDLTRVCRWAREYVQANPRSSADDLPWLAVVECEALDLIRLCAGAPAAPPLRQVSAPSVVEWLPANIASSVEIAARGPLDAKNLGEISRRLRREVERMGKRVSIKIRLSTDVVWGIECAISEARQQNTLLADILAAVARGEVSAAALTCVADYADKLASRAMPVAPAMPASPLVKPTIHDNGSGAKYLAESYALAADALSDAAKKIARTAPNGRDYYPQEEEAFGRACRQHEARMTALAQVRADLVTLYGHCRDSARAS